LLFKKQNIKIIPISLCLLTLLSIYGPQSAFTVSMYSQRQMVINFFKKHNGFKDGKLSPVDSTKINMQECSIGVGRLSYFIYHYDLKALQPYFKRDLNIVIDSLAKQKDAYDNSSVDREELRVLKYQWAKKKLGLNHFDIYFAYNDTKEVTAEQYLFYKKGNIIIVKNYDIMLDNYESTDSLVSKYNGLEIMQTNINRKSYVLKINNEILRFEPVQIVSKLLADSVNMSIYHQKNSDAPYAPHQYDLPATFMEITQETTNYKVTLIFERINFERKLKGTPVITSTMGKYLIKIK
jgi:hypothetical protein